jgi:hypothetical protein
MLKQTQHTHTHTTQKEIRLFIYPIKIVFVRTHLLQISIVNGGQISEYYYS